MTARPMWRRVASVRVRATVAATVVVAIALAIGGTAPMVLVVVALTTWVTVDRALRPVERIRSEVEDLAAGDLSRRVAVPRADDEVGRLARTMNAMLERLERASLRERGFAGNATHELRSHVVALRAQLEVARRDRVRDESWREADEEMLDGVLRVERLVDNLLVVARPEAVVDQPSRAVLDFDDVVFAEVGRARESAATPVYLTKLEPARVRGDSVALGTVVGYLLENAQRHASTSVTVELSTAAGSVNLVVADDGSGIAVENRQQVFERSTGLDDVLDEIRAHGGEVTVEERRGGGAQFVVVLPEA